MNMLSIIHGAITQYVKPGGVYIDATAGRGGDTLFLCKLAGERGSVTAFDIQAEALSSTAELLRQNGYCARLILDSHANMGNYFEHDSVDAIMFNLGYLPKGDHSVYTRFDSTSKAISAGLRLLKSGGLMTVGVYYGGDSGYEERDALMPFLKNLDDDKYQVLVTSFYNWRNDPPFPVFIIKN